MVSAGISNTLINGIDSVKSANNEKSTSTETDFTKVLEKHADVKDNVANDGKNEYNLANNDKKDCNLAENDKKDCNLAENDDMKEIVRKFFGNKDKEQNVVNVSEENTSEEALTVFVNIVNVIADNLNVEPEKVMETVNELGCKPGDLTDTTVINSIVKMITGMENVVNILTNKELSETIKNIYAQIEELAKTFGNDFGISKEELIEMLNSVEISLNKEKSGSYEVTDSNVTVEEPGYSETSDEEEMIDNNRVINNENISVSDEQSNSKNTAEDFQQNKSFSKNNETIVNSKVISHETSNDENVKHESEVHEVRGNETFSIMDGIREIIVDRITGEDNSLADKIVKQITDDIKMYATQSTTALEMQLEPESLGKVNLTVISKAGIVTAHLVVQNEVAREAIESQMSTLKETMNNQGIKVEAIEVTLASKEFEENLDGQKDNSEQHGQKHKRHLTEEELASFNGISTNSEEIKEEIMKEMGNTVSYIA